MTATAWRAKNPEKARAYRLKNRKKHRAYRRAYYSKHKSKWCEAHRLRYRGKNREKHLKRIAENHLRRAYGLSQAEYDRMHMAQGGLCAACHNPETAKSRSKGKVRKLAVDHNHKTCKVRALLCHDCNVALGLLRESAKRVKALLLYLEEHQ